MNRSQILRTRSRSRSPLTRAQIALARSAKRRRPTQKALQKAIRRTMQKHNHKSTQKLMLVGGIAAVVVTGTAVPVARWRRRKAAQNSQNGLVLGAALDQLTGLRTRDEAVRLTDAALERGQARGRRVALMCIDIEDFRGCLDLHGAQAGDHVLQVSAARMQAQVRSSDVVCRIGEDEFLVVVEGAGPDHVLTRIGERIVESLTEPITFNGEKIMIGANVGVAIAVNGEAEADEFISQAERAVDRARASGRHVVQY